MPSHKKPKKPKKTKKTKKTNTPKKIKTTDLSSLDSDVKKILIPKEQIKAMVLFDTNTKSQVKHILDKLPDDEKELELYFNSVFKKVIKHYIPIIMDLKKEKDFVK